MRLCNATIWACAGTLLFFILAVLAMIFQHWSVSIFLLLSLVSSILYAHFGRLCDELG